MRTWVLLSVLLALPAAAQRPLAQPNRPAAAPPRAQVNTVPGERDIRELRRSIRDLRGLASTLRNPGMVAEMERRLADMERSLAGLDTTRWDLIDAATRFEAEALTCAEALDEAQRPVRYAGERYREAWYPEPVVVEPPPPVVTTPQELAAIRRAVDNAAFRSDKVGTLRSAIRDRWFTSAQVVQLLEEFSFRQDKLEVATMMHPTVVDPQNWFTVYAALPFERDRRTLRERVGD